MFNACATALRTRMSLNGFLSFTSPYSSSSRAWSKVKYCVPMSPVLVTCSRPSVFSRSTSWNGGSSTMSTSPEVSAASRVASERMLVKTTCSTLPLRLSSWPHQPSWRMSRVRTSGS